MRILLLGLVVSWDEPFFCPCRDYPHWQVTPLGRGGVRHYRPGALIGALERHQPDVILNGAAYTAVDLAEFPSLRSPSASTGEGGVTLAREASAGGTAGALSTDYVFDGSGSGPWREADAPSPLNVYGASKLAASRPSRPCVPSIWCANQLALWREGHTSRVPFCAVPKRACP